MVVGSDCAQLTISPALLIMIAIASKNGPISRSSNAMVITATATARWSTVATARPAAVAM